MTTSEPVDRPTRDRRTHDRTTRDRTTRVLSVGVAVMDHVFRVDAFPTRAEKYRARDAAMVGGGGAANAAVAVARLGGAVHLAARVGDDAIADAIRADLAAEGVETALVRRHPGHRSSFSSVLVDDAGERQIVNFRDTGLSMDPAWLREALAGMAFDAVLADTRWPDGALAAMERAAELGIPAVMDAEAPVHEAADAVAAATHVVFSAQGLRDFVGADPDGGDLVAMLREAAGGLGAALVGVTDGPDGVRWIERGADRADAAVHHEPAPPPPDPLVDTLGAGDVWHGALALALGEGQGSAPAMRFANAAATLSLGGTGRGGAPDRAAVEAVLDAMPGRAAAGK